MTFSFRSHQSLRVHKAGEIKEALTHFSKSQEINPFVFNALDAQDFEKIHTL